MSRKQILWGAFVLLFVLSTIFALQYFSKAFPLVSLEIEMNRQSALQSAKELAVENNWGPADFRQAASFAVESQVQNFVELEAGGADAFSAMIRDTLYAPYTWRVRHFKENDVNEVKIYFEPNGAFYGFEEKIPEDEPGPSLSEDSARVVAESIAVNKWTLNLNEYELVEKSSEVRPSGRTDYTLIYERPDVRIGEGRYRLRLVLSGDQLSEIRHFVKIPEAFSRRYEEMRSANNTIATGSLIAIGILYVLGGIVFGLFYLLRKRYVLWRKALFWGLFVALLQVLAEINQFPLLWMNYDTALSAQGFLIQEIMQILLTFITMTVLLTGAFMAAESLTRLAFPNHLQLWKIWNKDVAASKQAAGQTVSGYLLVSIFFAFDIALYFIATNVLGWWSPSGALFEPDVLATYFPWLSSIAISLQAGFLEECLFRAIPIAGAVLLGRRFGYKSVWIIAAFIIQAVIFGAGHANYPNQPPYARVVELILPSIGFGLIYYFYGLLPAIIMHFAYDVVWFALPLFVSSASGVWLDQVLVIVLTLVPVWVVLGSRLRTKKWTEAGEQYYNGAWQPEPTEALVTEKPEPQPETSGISKKISGGLIITGLIGVLVWIFFSNFENKAQPLRIERERALAIADSVMQSKDISLSYNWRVLSKVTEPLDQDDRFVWQEGSVSAYRALMGTYLSPPAWKIRYATFEGDVAERAEEYQIYIGHKGKVLRYKHKLPEHRAGAALAQDSAKGMALGFVEEKYDLDSLSLKMISATPSKLKNRTDWAFTFADTINYPLEQGEARIAVNIAGDRIVDGFRYVHVPEEWDRRERKQQSLIKSLGMLKNIFVLLLFLTGVVVAIIGWSRKQFAVSTFLIFFLLLFLIRFVELVNGLPATMAGFSTAEPFQNQMILFLALPVIGILFIASAIGLIAGYTHVWKGETGAMERSGLSVGAGFALGAIVTGVVALVFQFEPALRPGWGNYSGLEKYIPFLNGLNDAGGFIIFTALNLFVLTALHRFTNGWRTKHFIYAPLFLIVGLIVNGSTETTIAFWLISGLSVTVIYLLFYIFVFRFQMGLIPLAIGGTVMLKSLKDAIINVHGSAIPAAILAVVTIVLIALLWYLKLGSQQKRSVS